jgi:hypothetical protein
MAAYNVRKRKSISIEPPTGWDRTKNRLRELVIFAICAGLMYLVYLVGRRFL